jgi:sulfite exporter TauE/SafE/copper chaperone CopZ
MIIRTAQLKVIGMQCSGCEQIIEAGLLKLTGIIKVKPNYSKKIVIIEFDNQLINEESIQTCIKEIGYEIQPTDPVKKCYLLHFLIFISLLLVVGGVAFWGKSLMPELLPQLNAQMSNLMLFSIGFLTGFHCIGMCGSFIVSYACESNSAVKSLLNHLAYGVGKTASYSALGAAFGLLGATITITPHMRGVIALVAGVFLLLYGLKMLDFIPSLRRLTIRLPKAFTRNINTQIRSQRSPFIIGVLTGFLLGCGPLQVLYIMAAGTGSPQEGATLLFFFGLGTLVPLLSFGFFATLLSRNTIYELVKVSGILVIIMGIMMVNRGLKMTQSGYDFNSLRGHIQQTTSSIHSKSLK